MVSLPLSDGLNISSLSRLFDNTTNSYKYLFFRALLNHLYCAKFDESIISLDTLIDEMLCDAWYPYIYYRLSFGSQDQIAIIIDRCDAHAIKHDQLRNCFRNNRAITADLQRYVPYRLITVFFENELRGISDTQKNRKIFGLAETSFNTVKPLYKLIEQDSKIAIELHSDWMKYLYENFPIIKSWANWGWLQYLQKKNPHVPALSQKLSPPPDRAVLTQQTNYWKKVIDSRKQSGQPPLRCIYTDHEITPNYKFALDHFLPWSFVGHDQLWNLIPANPRVNSSKSNNLPHENYLSKLINFQYEGLITSRDALTENKWHRDTECFVSDLKLSSDQLTMQEYLESAYKITVLPLIQLARNMGFSAGWRL